MYVCLCAYTYIHTHTHTHREGISEKFIYFCNIIIIIMSCWQHRYPWSSLTTPPYRSLLLAGLQGYIPYLHRATVCRFESSSWLCSAMWRGPQEHITYELVPTSPAVSRMPGSSNFDTFMMGGRWPYSSCFVGCCLFNIARSILA